MHAPCDCARRACEWLFVLNPFSLNVVLFECVLREVWSCMERGVIPARCCGGCVRGGVCRFGDSLSMTASVVNLLFTKFMVGLGPLIIKTNETALLRIVHK